MPGKLPVGVVAALVALVGTLVTAAILLFTPVFQSRMDQQYRPGSLSFSIPGLAEEITIALDGGDRRKVSPQANFVRFENVQPGVHQVHYSNAAGESRAEVLNTTGGAHLLFDLPLIGQAKPAEISMLVPKSPPPNVLQPLQPLPPLSTEASCCWIFLGSFASRISSVVVGSDATIATEGQFPTENQYYLTRIDVPVRNTPLVRDRSLFEEKKDKSRIVGVIRAGTVIRLEKVDDPGVGNAPHPIWAKVVVFASSTK